MGRKKSTSTHDESGASGAAGVVAGGKLKKKALVIADDEYSIGTESSKDVVVPEENLAPVGNKKKGKKRGSKKTGQKEEDDDAMDNEAMEEDEDDAPAIKFAGKKKSKGKKSGTNSVFSSSTFGLLGEDEEGDDIEMKDNDDEESGEPVIIFSGKRKPSKSKKGGGGFSSAFDSNEDVAETSTKNKKKKKKGGKAGQEDDDDLDKILAELGVIPPGPKDVPTYAEIPPEEIVQNHPEVEEVKEEEPAVSAAAKKKKKKKEKEKEKKAAAAEEKLKETEIEASNGKKFPMHVREKQEMLARRMELEEKRKREEEEKQQKEEEERIRKEEEERIAEEKKRLKKEKEKEKRLEKKLEGKLLTRKQKGEAHRLEAKRMQILAKATLQIPTGETGGAPAKRPLYQKKKPKPHTQSNGAATLDSAEGTESKETQQEIVLELDSPEGESVEDVASWSAKDNNDATDVVQENVVEEEEEYDDDEWDAKSWDETDLKLPAKSAFADEEIDSEPEPLVRKEIKSARPATQDVELPSVATKTVEKVASVMPKRSENVDVKKKNSEAEYSDKYNTKSVVNRENNRKEKKSDDHPVQNGQNLRSPICCIMGHVDTGKTTLLDCIRGTNVQEGEAGGITQQIGATYFPAENIRERTRELKADARLNVPGLLVIDTPGHDSFTNLRSRGSGLCDIAILIVNIMRGLEPQTIESLNLLKKINADFIIALNKVDKIYGWKTCHNAPIKEALSQQSNDVQIVFNDGLKKVKNQLQEQGLNTELYYKNKEMGETYNIVPTSAKSGEGIPDLLFLLVQWTQRTMIERLTYSNEVQCTVLEVKVVEGHGTTIDVVLVNGVLREGDQIVVCGVQGPIVTSIRALLTPHPMKELRVKGYYLHHKEIKAAMGIKITAQGLEHTIAGTSLYVVGPHDDLEEIKQAADMKSVINRIDIGGEGVHVQASTLGSLEALLEFLKTPAVNVPVSGISIGPVHKKDVMKASVMLEKKKEYGTILAFDVNVTQEARELADYHGVKIFTANIIYHLIDQLKAYIDNLKEEKKKEAAGEAVFPCVLEIMPNSVFNKKHPIVLGVNVLEGIAKIGTPLCVPQREFIDIGRIASIEDNHKPLDYAKKGQKVSIKIIGSNPDERQKMFGRHFEMDDELVSKISRNSLDALNEHYMDELSVQEKRLLSTLKKLFRIL